MPISAIINTLNEEKNIRACLESVKWVDEIILVDMYSDDSTIEIAKEYTDKIYFHDRIGYVEPARNFAIQKTNNTWVLVIDADERVTTELQYEICDLIQKDTEYAALRIFFQENIFGKKIHYGSWQYQKHTRLFRKDKCNWPANVHGSPLINGETGDLQGVIEHYSHLTIGHFLNKLNTYTTIEAREWFDKGVRKTLFNCFYYGGGKFLKEFIYYRGYKDGQHGLILAALYGIYYFAARVKLWELWYKHDHGIQL